MRRLGLDIGTNSIGWCLIEDDERIIDIGVRIFSDGRDPKSGASLAVDRREARAMRRRRDRYIGRRSAFLDSLVDYGLMPADSDEAKLVAERDPYAIRARALTERLEPYEIGRALFHLNQRRGFKSNRKADRRVKDNEDGKIASGAKALDQAMAESGADTLGQFLAGRDQKRVRLDSDAQGYDFYPQRRHIDYEFGRIWEEQATHHPALLTDEARAALHRILFFQRPLKEAVVGVCTFVQTERRLPKAHPLFQQRRLYEEVNQLEITTPGEAPRKLTLDQRDALILELRGKRKVAFSTLARRLKLQPGESFNKASETRTDLAGDEVHAVLADKKRFGKAWAHLPAERQWTIIARLIDEEDPDALHMFLTEECGLDDEAARNTAKAPLPEGHGRLGETATRRILDELRREVITYDEAVRRAGWHHSDDRTSKSLDCLPYYGELLARDIPPGSQLATDPPEKRFGKITNPTVHIGLRQLEKLVNAIIAIHGKPDQIVVELARELKLNEKDRAEHDRRIHRDTVAAIARGEYLEREGIANTGANRALFKLWEQLNPANPLDRRCPYCAEPIGMRQLFSGEADVDHIIPYSRSLDDSASNKVVAHRHCNRSKGNRTPHERWGHDAGTWDKIAGQVARLHRSKQWRFGPDAMERVAKDGGFLARQLTDTQYLSRLAGKYLRSLYPTKEDGSVYVIPGRMTAMLRRLWGLNSLLSDHNYVENAHSSAPKNRLDHRHHAIDAAVTAVTTRSLLQRIARVAGQAEDKDLDRLFEGLDQPWEGFREQLGAALERVTISHKPDHGRKGRPARDRDVTSGQLHNETAYGLTGDVNRKGDSLVVYRIALANLQPKDLTDPERMTDHALQNALYAATRGATGSAFQKALADFSKAPGPWQGIRRVRVRKPLQVIPIRDATGRAYKGYQGDSNALYTVWRLPDGKWVTHWTDADGIARSGIVSTFDYHQKDYVEHRPHPAAKKVLMLRQNDLIAIERDGGPREIMRVQKYGQNGQVFLIAHNEAGKMAERDKNPDDPFKFYGPGASALQKMKARQVRIDPLGRIFDPGPR
ncbi:type II CRISPR RNA-guided endonuclease Cas9 [Hephaestia sp. GCM10023244]|uniref:type II CRISPR RNA-guided endonuclease Cas9 n=1 Tax=unclassified Hephaestia TaxID=2631281 RepID=UPI002076ECC7|nr:type II CRISPR RNA-guided endonuclease Cas9 [Hephaestia sp. MAHUQ-44]MCM8730903.1 type II CRISPR RNA-guided endonuclease Cas9 [Hephaestia sp. MAHUQ-44]